MRKPLLLILLNLCLIQLSAQNFKNSEVAVEKRVEDLLQRMTIEEKFFQLFMIPESFDENPDRFRNGIFGLQIRKSDIVAHPSYQFSGEVNDGSAEQSAKKINEVQKFFIEKSKLGIPVIPFEEALHGLVSEDATIFPQSIGLSATFNTLLMDEVCSAIATECSTRGIRMVLSPVVNVATDVRWGRTEETYGEDPYLVSQMGLSYVKAFEKAGIITTPKHFAANIGDGGRDSYPVHWNNRYLSEIIFPPFETCIKEGSAKSIMTSYNSVDGTPATANSWLLNKKLKDEWAFDGFVISDAGATGGANVLHFTAADYADATAKSFNAGLDVVFQTDYNHYKLFIDPFLDGRINQSIIDKAVSRVLRIKFMLGLFDNPYVDPEIAKKWSHHPDHIKLAKKSALESIVLLKNENQILPLSKNYQKIAVVGADAVDARTGGYSGSGKNNVSILQGIRSIAGENVQVNYANGCSREDITYVPVPKSALHCEIGGIIKNGLKGEYFNNIDFLGEPALTRCDEGINFQWTLFSPDPSLISYDFYSVRWTGKIIAPETDTVQIGIEGNDGYRLYIDGKIVIDRWLKISKNTKLASFYFEKDKYYDIIIEFYEPTGNAWFKLVWDAGVKNTQSQEIEKAVSLAAMSDVTVITAGIIEGEFCDRALLSLPGRQEEMIKKISATGKPVIVILVGGSAITMNTWIGDVDGIIDVWYPGEQGGNAVAEVLFGNYNPAGRLPVSFPVSEGQLPLVYNHKPTGRGDDYVNLTGQPLFPFGYGLSYTNFKYSDIRLSSNKIGPADSAYVSVKVSNTGEMDGDEVVQLYIRDELASVSRPITELKGFKRIHLKQGETKETGFWITPDKLSMLNNELETVVESGLFSIMIGASCKDIRQKTDLIVTGQ